MSAGFTGKVREFFGFGEIDQYSEAKYYDDEVVREPRQTSVRADRDDYRYEDEGKVDHMERPGHSRGLDSDIDSRYRSSHRESGRYRPVAERRPEPIAKANPQYVPLHLSAYKDATEVVDVVKTGDVVVFTLSGVERTEATRALDFISGARRALDADLKKLSGVRNFILIPSGVTLDQTQMDSLAREL